MAAHRSRRALPVVALTLVLAATLPSCDRGADAPADNNRPAAVAPAPAPPPHPLRRRASSPGAGKSI